MTALADRRRFATLSVAALVVLAVGCTAEPETPDDGVPDTRTLEHRGVRLDLSATWVRLDTSGCEFPSDRWGPSGTDACRSFDGLAFYGSATLDPTFQPGVVREDDGAWSGYVRAGDVAVDVHSADRAVVRDVLGSVTPG